MENEQNRQIKYIPKEIITNKYMANNTKFEHEVMKVHNLFWQALAKRDSETRFSVCSDSITCFGTGLHERAVGIKQTREMNEKGILQSPQPFEINTIWETVRVIDKVAWVESETLWVTQVNDANVKSVLRLTTIFEKSNDKWLVVHFHGSEPDYRLQDGDYMYTDTNLHLDPELERKVYVRTDELNQSLKELKDTQEQLVKSEKLAAFGAVATRVAHEILNPINFVKNFSIITEELIDEMKSSITEAEKEEKMNEIKTNLQKINHHSKRADDIMKQLFEHTRKGTAQEYFEDKKS